MKRDVPVFQGHVDGEAMIPNRGVLQNKPPAFNIIKHEEQGIEGKFELLKQTGSDVSEIDMRSARSLAMKPNTSTLTTARI